MLRIHHLPVGEATVSDFQVSINGETTRPWFCRVSALPYNTVWPGRQRPVEQSEAASFISFEMDEPVKLELMAAKDFAEVVVRPLSKNVKPRVSGRRIAFEIEKPGQYTVELDGWHKALHIFANPVNDFGVDKSDPNVIYYGPGVYDIGDMELTEGQTLFVDGGAVLYGSVTACHSDRVRVVGYGVIDGSREVRTDDTMLIAWDVEHAAPLREESVLRGYIKKYNVLNGCVHFYSCDDCEIAGVIARDSSTFAFIVADCERMNCEWIKTIGMWRYNSDGIDLFNSRYVRISNSFLRDFDDCIVIKGIKGWDTIDLHHITVTGCTVWCDWGRALELGAETCADEYYDILWEDCDIIHAAHIHIDLQNSDRAWIHDMLVRNIRCEYSRYDMLPVYQHDMNAPYTDYDTPWQPVLIESPIYDGPYSNDHILGKTSGVRFENIEAIGPADMDAPVIRFKGMDAEHCNSGIIIENVSLNGRRLKPGEVRLELGKFDKVEVK